MCKELRPAVEAYERLTKAAGPELVAQWTADAVAADAARDDNVEAMDIYDIHGKPCKRTCFLCELLCCY